MNKKGHSVPDISPIIRKLKATLQDRQADLSRLALSFSKLKDDLVRVKREHDIRIGSILSEIDELDYDLFHFRKVKDLMEKGLSFEDAETLVKQREDTEFKRHAQAADVSEEEIPKAPPIAREDAAELKRLYRKLAHKFHPDVQDGQEEKMKIINRAYAEGNLETLRAMDRDDEFIESPDLTVEALQERIESLEGMIVRLRQKQAAFRRSEWFAWKKELERAEKEDRDLLAEKERLMRTDLAKKKQELARLKRSLAQRSGKDV